MMIDSDQVGQIAPKFGHDALLRSLEFLILTFSARQSCPCALGSRGTGRAFPCTGTVEDN